MNIVKSPKADYGKNFNQFSPHFFQHFDIFPTIPSEKCHFYRVFDPYRLFVASPPRICRSALFFSKISRASRYNPRFTLLSRSVISLCTVDLDIPNFFAALLTVAPYKTMYLANISHRSPSALITHTPFPKASTEKYSFHSRNNGVNALRYIM